MRVVALVIVIGWVLFWLYWLLSAVRAKPSRGPREWAVGVRVGLVIVVGIGVRLSIAHHLADPTSSLWRQGTGLALWAAGLALAVWARIYIGRNWGMPMTRREEPELVTSGPYRTVRHPIYTGILLALLGTVLATTAFGLIAVVLVAVYFAFSAVREERYLISVFPDQYPAYQRSSKRLVPFVW